MKKLWMLMISMMAFSVCIMAQQQTEYNKKGDEAMKRLDYDDARLFYGEGMSYCDMYSIHQLTSIWMASETMRTSMHNLMNRCLGCLNVKATENDTTAISLLIRYYTEGIGTTRSTEMATYWTEQLEEINHPVVQPDESSGVIPPPARYPLSYFAGYSFSVLSPAGITIGAAGNRFGGFLRFKTNLSFQAYENSFTGKGPANIPEGTFLKPVVAPGEKNIEKKSNFYVVTGGLIARYKPLHFFIGLGYWQREVMYKYAEVDDVENETGNYFWYKHADASYKGIAADVDVMMQIGKFYLSLGCNLLNHIGENNQFKLIPDLNVGAGIFF
ncbi:MAG: hypothetical protein LBD89_06070 [Tannerellaceae bacterium]|jgi:hypothetical protein|nr:hypothetical protein [Tannerellaceae bacterium]